MCKRESMKFDISKVMPQHRLWLCDLFTAVPFTAQAEVLIWFRDAEQVSTPVAYKYRHPDYNLSAINASYSQWRETSAVRINSSVAVYF